MAAIYILYSPAIDRFYVGSCENLEHRLNQHRKLVFPNSFTSKTTDWIVFYKKENLTYKTARSIEKHIKRMKSRKYYHDLKKHEEIIDRLISKYTGSSR